jgi:hypothetical protein
MRDLVSGVLHGEIASVQKNPLWHRVFRYLEDNSMDVGHGRANGKVTMRKRAIGVPFWLTNDAQIPAQTEAWATRGVSAIPRRGNPG